MMRPSCVAAFQDFPFSLDSLTKTTLLWAAKFSAVQQPMPIQDRQAKARLAQKIATEKLEVFRCTGNVSWKPGAERRIAPKRFWARYKTQAVLRRLRGKNIDLASRELAGEGGDYARATAPITGTKSTPPRTLGTALSSAAMPRRQTGPTQRNLSPSWMRSTRRSARVFSRTRDTAANSIAMCFRFEALPTASCTRPLASPALTPISTSRGREHPYW